MSSVIVRIRTTLLPWYFFLRKELGDDREIQVVTRVFAGQVLRRSRVLCTSALSPRDEEVLRAEAICVVRFGGALLLSACVSPVLAENARLSRILQIGLEYLAKQSLTQDWVLDGKHDLDPLV